MNQQINLFTPQFRKQVVLLSADLMAVGAAVVLLMAITAFIWLTISTRDLQSQADASKVALAEAEAKLAQLAIDRDPVAQAKALERNIASLEAATQEKRDVADMLKSGDLGDITGYSDYLRALARQIVDGVWIRGFDIANAGRHFTVDGSTLRADLIPQYIKRLSSEKALQGRQFAMLTLQAPKAADNKNGEKSDASKSDENAKATKPYLDFHLSSELSKPKDGDGSANASAVDRYSQFAKAAQDAQKEVP